MDIWTNCLHPTTTTVVQGLKLGIIQHEASPRSLAACSIHPVFTLTPRFFLLSFSPFSGSKIKDQKHFLGSIPPLSPRPLFSSFNLRRSHSTSLNLPSVSAHSCHWSIKVSDEKPEVTTNRESCSLWDSSSLGELGWRVEKLLNQRSGWRACRLVF